MAWQQLTLDIAATDFPQAEALLRLAGAASIAISDAGDAPILEPQPGTAPLWPRLSVRALFDDSFDLSGIGAVLGPLCRATRGPEPVTEEDIERAARQIVRPIEIGPRLTIVPADALDADDGRALGLHMGLAFGTGLHPTTRLCLQWLDRQLTDAPVVLDYGCGSGVLALAALKLGARSATAIDIEPQALEAARRNAELNRLESALRIGPPASLGRGPYDVVLTNILAKPLMGLAERFASLQPPGGQIVLSGLLSAQLDAVAARFGRWYRAQEAETLDGWCRLTGQRRSEYDR